MNETDKRVLAVLHEPRTNAKIANLTHLHRSDVRKALKNLRNEGLLVSRGATAARTHMSLAAAIESLFDHVDGLHRELNTGSIRRGSN